jgi:hypothetical protein
MYLKIKFSCFQVPVWSSVSVAGVKFRELNENFGKEGDSENWNQCFEQVCQGYYRYIFIIFFCEIFFLILISGQL